MSVYHRQMIHYSFIQRISSVILKQAVKDSLTVFHCALIPKYNLSSPSWCNESDSILHLWSVSKGSDVIHLSEAVMRYFPALLGVHIYFSPLSLMKTAFQTFACAFLATCLKKKQKNTASRVFLVLNANLGVAKSNHWSILSVFNVSDENKNAHKQSSRLSISIPQLRSLFTIQPSIILSLISRL